MNVLTHAEQLHLHELTEQRRNVQPVGSALAACVHFTRAALDPRKLSYTDPVVMQTLLRWGFRQDAHDAVNSPWRRKFSEQLSVVIRYGVVRLEVWGFEHESVSQILTLGSLYRLCLDVEEHVGSTNEEPVPPRMSSYFPELARVVAEAGLPPFVDSKDMPRPQAMLYFGSSKPAEPVRGKAANAVVVDEITPEKAVVERVLDNGSVLAFTGITVEPEKRLEAYGSQLGPSVAEDLKAWEVDINPQVAKDFLKAGDDIVGIIEPEVGGYEIVPGSVKEDLGFDDDTPLDDESRRLLSDAVQRHDLVPDLKAIAEEKALGGYAPLLVSPQDEMAGIPDSSLVMDELTKDSKFNRVFIGTPKTVDDACSLKPEQGKPLGRR